MKSRYVTSLAALGTLLAAGMSQANAKDLTLCWAAWDPANALVELSKDFEAKSGVKMKFEFVPWPNFADRMLNELNSGGKLCDLCPTMLDLMGLEKPAEMTGESLIVD